VRRVGRCRAEPDEVDDLEDAKGVDEEERHEPLSLIAAGGVPESEAF